MLIIDSNDRGRTWSSATPRNVTDSVVANGKVRVFFGMVNGIELTSSSSSLQPHSQPHPGRIVIPGWALLNRTGVTGKYDVSGSALMYSDDHGHTWEVGEVLTKGGRIENTQPSESTVVE